MPIAEICHCGLRLRRVLLPATFSLIERIERIGLNTLRFSAAPDVTGACPVPYCHGLSISTVTLDIGNVAL